MTIDTKAVPRRSLRIGSLDEALGELSTIEGAIDAGTIGHTGNWTPGEIMDHCAIFIRCTIDGFDGSAPAPVRWIARAMLKKSAVNPEKPFPAGYKLPKQAASMLPEPGVDDREGLRRLREQIGRLQAGERMTQPSPLMGPLTHDEWMVMQLKHLDLHLSFIVVGEG